MAKNNEVQARVRLSIGGVEASKKNLEALEEAAKNFRRQIAALEQKKLKLIEEGDLAGANKMIKEMDRVNKLMKANDTMIAQQKDEIVVYQNILENLTTHSLATLQRGLRALQSQMKNTLTSEDVEQYKKLRDAYDQVLDKVNQLSGKAPNLNYVLANLGTVAGKTLKDSVEYVKKMISETEKGSARLVGLESQLSKLEGEQQARLANSAKTAMGNVSGKPFAGTETESRQALETLKEYKATLNMSTQAAEIQKVNAAMTAYNEALEKVKGTAIDVSAVLKDPKNFSTDQIEKAIKQLEEDGKKIKFGDTDAIQQNIADIEKLKQALSSANYSDSFVGQVIKDIKDGKASVEELEKAIAMTKEKLRYSKDATMTEKLKQDLDKLNPALELTKTSLERVDKTLKNVKVANLGSLKEAAERLKVEINDVNIKMDDFAKKAAQLKKVNAQIKELESQTKNVASAWDNAVSRLKNWVLIYAGSSEIFNKMVQAYQGSLKLSDAMTDVQKTTGLAADEVVRLTDEVQELDTRITNEKLMEAATEAGRIGLKTRQEVLEFTRASAITLTALDELDARSITSVMKLNSLLGETARLGVQQAILSTASSINELSMASSAAQQPIIDFSRRFGGIAAQANISTAEVLGLGATIDALGQPIEMSSTALNKFTTALLSNGKQIAEDTGLSEEYVFKMTRQGKTIELMIEVLSKLNNMGGIGEISKYMGDMGGDGARMTAVVSALAANLGFLREQIDLSKMSFEEGISVINEYNLKNENAAAIVARAGNEIKEILVNSTAVKHLTSFLKHLLDFIQYIRSGALGAKALGVAMTFVLGKLLMTRTILGKLFTDFIHGKKQIISLTAVTNALGQSLMTAGLKALAFVRDFSAIKTANGILAAFRFTVDSVTKSLWALFKTNPLGWVALIVTAGQVIYSWLSNVKEETEETKSAVDRANEAFEEESYKLNKLRDALDAAKKSGDGFAEVVSTLNRDYGKQIGYVLDLAASYEEVAGAIDLAVAAKRRQILQEEKDKNFQQVQDEYRDETNDQINALKKAIGIGSAKGRFDDFSETVQKELYAAIASDLNKSASVAGKAELGKEVEAVLRRQAKAAAMTYYRKSTGMTDEELAKFDTSGKEKVLYDMYKQRLNSISSIEELAEIYTNKANKIKELDEEVNRQLDAQTEVVADLQQKQIDLISEQNNLANKAAKDYTADDEHTLSSIVSLYESMLTNMSADMDKTKWDEINEELTFFKARQREVMLAFVENPLRGVKMKVGEDGKLYKEVMANGKLQYESVKELSDANLRQLVDAYRRTESTFQKLISDENHLMDSKVREQADKLSKVKIAINRELQKNGIDIDDKGELKLRRTEFRDGTERDSDKDARAAYKALLDNMEEYYGKRKEIILARLLAEGKTIKEKNLEMKKWEVEYRQGLVDMQSELLGKGESFEENVFIRDIENYKKAAALIQNATKTFQDKVANDMQKNRNKILELQFLPAGRTGGGDAEKGIRKAYTAILKNIEEYYAKQKQLVETDYLNSTITVEDKNRRLEELELQHWQARISMQREVLGEGNFFNENLYIRDLENFQYVKKHMLDESHHYQDTVRADMENTIYEQEALLAKHKRKVDEIILGNDYQAQVDKEMQDALEIAGLFWGEAQDRTEKNADAITAAMKEAAKDSYAIEADKFRTILEENKTFGDTVKAMNEEQYAAFLILLQQFHDKTIEADKKFADQRRKITQQMWESGGYENEYNFANDRIRNRQENLNQSKGFGATTDKKAYEEQYRLTLEQWALEEWRFQMQYDLAIKAGETEEQLLARRMEMAEMEKEMQRQVTEAYLEEYNRRADKMAQHAEKFGEFAGVMASAAWNTVEDRKKAGEELLRYIAQESAEYIRELLVRKIKEEVLRRQGLKEAKKGEEEKQDIEQKGVEASTKISEIGGKIKTGIEEKVAGEVSDIATSGAAKSATTAVKKANVDAAAGAASGAAKTIGELGWWGIPLIAAIEGVISMLLNMAFSALSSSFGTSASTNKASSKRLATGMLTYANGRYPTMGDDGVTYDAQYEPRLQTRIYQGGKGKAHMALFSEVMPEMVISGPTTKIIQEDFPGLMNAIMMIDKYGTLPQPRRVRRYADGNMDEFDVDVRQGADGIFAESPAIAELRQSNAELRQAVAVLSEKLSNPIPVYINMYGTGGIKESMDKANKFYTKNRIKS